VKQLLENIYPILIWVAVIGAVFAYGWHKGYLKRLSDYIQETRDELKKCTWPTIQELKGSTLVVMITIVLLGAFTVGVNFVFTIVIRHLIS